MSNVNDRDYKDGNLTVYWRPDKCVHCQECINGLPQVFNLEARPWVNLKGASQEQIRLQVQKCPSGALSVND